MKRWSWLALLVACSKHAAEPVAVRNEPAPAPPPPPAPSRVVEIANEGGVTHVKLMPDKVEVLAADVPNTKYGDSGPLPPTAAAPAGTTVTIGSVDVEVTDPYKKPMKKRHDKIQGVICEAHGARATYPKTQWDNGFGPDAAKRTVRWVSTDPPIFEIAADSQDPTGPADGPHSIVRTYARACDPEFDEYAWLGDDVWGSFALKDHDPPNGFGAGEPPRRDGEWTFHVGGKDIGKVEGTADLRANVWAK